ncbi:helix-turn-helix domain-containing protein [Streptacidiphilus anmyonensis]|uniref:helix-turn-helix domain-containing protein n=1 Tax=Streptacidiphilus anmyonensis TaxID=405782 RepID=UPI0005A7AD02|nr:helix-turn-helix transcriptional regulator [Streptacidiphilus anmyonensis]
MSTTPLEAAEELARLLRGALEETGLTLHQLARAAGIPQARLASWLDGGRGTATGFAAEELRAVADALPGHYTVADLFRAAGRHVPGDLDAEREQRLLEIYRRMDVSRQRSLIAVAREMA